MCIYVYDIGYTVWAVSKLIHIYHRANEFCVEVRQQASNANVK